MELKVLSEVNTEARERRRSGLKEEARLPPIRPKYSSRSQPQQEVKERKEEDLASDNTHQESGTTGETGKEEDTQHEEEELEEKEEKEVEKNVDADLKEEKSGGKISKFFSNFKRKKHEGDKAQTNGYLHEEGKKEHESDKGEDNNDDTKEPSPEKGKKRVSFFRQFSKEKKEDDRKEMKKTLPLKQDELREDKENMVSLKEEKIEDIPEEENARDSEEKEEDEEESETEDDTEEESELSTTTSPAYRNVEREQRQVKTNTKPVANISGQRQTNNKVKSKSCVIL